jgi:hypothetical protein
MAIEHNLNNIQQYQKASPHTQRIAHRINPNLEA